MIPPVQYDAHDGTLRTSGLKVTFFFSKNTNFDSNDQFWRFIKIFIWY